MDLKINRVNGTIVIEKNDQKLAISQAVDNDIWFTSFKENVALEINMSSRNHFERQVYIIFESLMKLIIGRYILDGDNKSKYSMLTTDFINLENRVIVWHSDSGTDNILKL